MKKVWDILTAPCPIDRQKVRWFARSARGNLGGIARSPEALEQVARLSYQGYDCYVTLNPTNDRICKRIRAEDVTRWAFILIDLDPVSENPTMFVSTPIQRLLRAEGVRPAIVGSGRGRQLWVRVDARDVNSANRQFYTDVNRGFLEHIRPSVARGWRLDMVNDLSRVARLPGSINQKTGVMASLDYTGHIADPAATTHILTYHKPSISPQTLSPIGWTKDWIEVQDDISLTAKMFILGGAESGNRHRTMHHTCKSLWENGVRKESALEALWLGNESCDELLPERDVRSILEQVYRKGADGANDG